jgi:outer membrane protein TolC
MSQTATYWRCAMAAIAVALGGLAATAQSATSAPVVITLAAAIHRAQQNEPAFANAVAAERSAAADRYIAKAGLLPGVIYHNQVLYTEPNGQTNRAGQIGIQPSPVFIANNAVREYASQASINEQIGMQQIADAQVASAHAAMASAELEIARRGLVASVVSLFYAVSTSDTRERLFAQALDEARNFTDLTQKREQAREVAHADVVKAQLEQQQRELDANEAALSAKKARLELGVLLFADPRTAYSTASPDAEPALPTHDELSHSASANNPEVRSALAAMRASDAEVISAKAAYLPDLKLNFTYGIDAPEFAKRGPDDVQNLGYSISGTVDIPVWDWFSTQKRVKQSEIRRDAAHVTLTATQRRLIATLEETYAEAVAARDQMDLLERSVQTSNESLRLTKLRYGAGEATALEVVDAENASLAAGVAQADGAARYQSAFAALELLRGNL